MITRSKNKKYKETKYVQKQFDFKNFSSLPKDLFQTVCNYLYKCKFCLRYVIYKNHGNCPKIYNQTSFPDLSYDLNTFIYYFKTPFIINSLYTNLTYINSNNTDNIYQKVYHANMIYIKYNKIYTFINIQYYLKLLNAKLSSEIKTRNEYTLITFPLKKTLQLYTNKLKKHVWFYSDFINIHLKTNNTNILNNILNDQQKKLGQIRFYFYIDKKLFTNLISIAEHLPL